jgi:hypothetical protein
MSKTFVAHKFRLKPTNEQALVLESWCHINRYLWNHYLSANKIKRTCCFPAQAAVYSSGRAVLITPIRP